MVDFSLRSIPENPGIYAMYDHANKVVYVGISTNLRKRIGQHIIRRNSSVTTTESATVLNPDKVSHICWWLHPKFFKANGKANEDNLKAAEFIAAKVLNPVLRSRSNPGNRAKTILENQTFVGEMECLFRDDPSGIFQPKTFDNLAKLVLELYERVSELEKQLRQTKDDM